MFLVAIEESELRQRAKRSPDDDCNNNRDKLPEKRSGPQRNFDDFSHESPPVLTVAVVSLIFAIIIICVYSIRKKIMCI